MPRLTTPALALWLRDYSETSQLVNALTRTGGRIGALAKGTKRPKSSLGGPLELLILEELTLSRRNTSQSLWNVTGRQMIEPWRPFRHSLARYYAGLHVLELCRRATALEDPAPQLFDLAVETLFRLAYRPLRAAELFYFEVQALGLRGQGPVFDRCVECERPRPSGGRHRFRFSCAQGGLLCPGCVRLDPLAIELAPGVASVLTSLSRLAPDQLDRLSIAPPLNQAIRWLLTHYHTFVDRQPLRAEPLLLGRL